MPQIITISAVSGAGKDVFIGNLLKRFSTFYFPESETTRVLTVRDLNSTKKYIQTSESDFKQKIKDDYFLEWGKNHGNYYGTPKSALLKSSQANKDLLLEIDVKKAKDLLLDKDFEYDFRPKGFFLWRKFHPLSNFKLIDLIKSVETNIRTRDGGIDDKSVRDRVTSTLFEYKAVEEYAHLFKFIENVEYDPLSAVKDFSIYYNPGK